MNIYKQKGMMIEFYKIQFKKYKVKFRKKLTEKQKENMIGGKKREKLKIIENEFESSTPE